MQDGQARYGFHDDNSAGRILTPADMPDTLPAEVTTLFFGGISLACEPCGLAYADLLARCADDRAVMLDPNIRPGFIADEQLYRARLARMLERADIVKLSAEDLGWLAPGHSSLEAKLDAVRATGAAW